MSISQSLVCRTIGIFDLNFLFINILHVGKTIYITAGTEAFRITSNGNNLTCLPEPSLESNQEEADTKVFLCATFAAELGYQKVRIVTIDSDIGTLVLYYQQKADADLLLEIGTGPNLKIIDISTYYLPVDITDALPGLHAIFGCGTTSCFIGIGKKECLSILQSNARLLTAMGTLGESTELEQNTLSVLEEYVCRLYSMKNGNSINKAR